MELITGHSGSNHVSSADIASMLRGMFTTEDVVLSNGDMLDCTVISSNTVQIGTGDCMLQGHHARVEVAETLTLNSCSVGYQRIDLVVARYTLGSSNIQDVYLAVVEGDPIVGTPSAPDYTEGDIDNGDLVAEFPLWSIPIDGPTVGTPVRIMPVVGTIQDQVSARGVYATSTTAAGTAAKVASYDGFELTTGATVYVCFSYANTAANATLNVNGTGAYPIYANNSATAANLAWVAGETVPFVFDGSAWRMVGSAGTTANAAAISALRESVSRVEYTLTWTSQNYVLQEDFARIHCFKVAPNLAVLSLNMQVSANPPTIFSEIGRISGLRTACGTIINIPGQKKQSHIGMQVTEDGIIHIWNELSEATGWFRAIIPIVLP